jgi:pyrroloquinoline quinone biosynthesis protein D
MGLACPLQFNMRATTISESARPNLTTGVRLQADSAGGKSVLLFPEGIIELNETAHEILARCDGRTVREIVSELATEYDADAKMLAVDVHHTLLELVQRKLIQFK